MKDKKLNMLSEEITLSPLGKKEAAIGNHNGFKFTISAFNNNYTIVMPVKLSQEYTKVKLLYFLDNLKVDYEKIKEVTYSNNNIIISYLAKGNKEKSVNELATILDSLTEELSNNRLSSCCSLCGENIETSPFSINEAIILCCQSCQSEVHRDISYRQEEIKDQPNNIPLGILGAFLGSLIGVVLWIIVSYMGYISAFCSIVLVYCCIGGYKKLGGKLNISGVIITSFIVLLMVFVASYLSLGFSAYAEFKAYDATLIDCIKDIPIFLTHDEIKAAFMKDLLTGYLFTVIVAVSIYIKAYKDYNYKINAEEIDVNS